MFHSDYSAPVTVWYHVCKFPIVQIKWCSLFFSEDAGSKARKVGSKFMTRLCEFFVIDKSENFLIFNLTKEQNKPVHQIQFSDRHQSLGNADLLKIS